MNPAADDIDDGFQDFQQAEARDSRVSKNDFLIQPNISVEEITQEESKKPEVTVKEKPKKSSVSQGGGIFKSLFRKKGKQTASTDSFAQKDKGGNKKDKKSPVEMPKPSADQSKKQVKFSKVQKYSTTKK